MAPAFLQAAQTCDRECLVTVMKNYLAALVAHNPSAVPFDPYVKFTQNTANIPVGYGLWETASGGPSEFQIYAADPVNQQVAGLFMMKENKKNILHTAWSSSSSQARKNRRSRTSRGSGE
jgi:hypothetical protein